MLPPRRAVQSPVLANVCRRPAAHEGGALASEAGDLCRNLCLSLPVLFCGLLAGEDSAPDGEQAAAPGVVHIELARAFTKWTKACDKSLNRLISYIHHTCEYRQYCHVGNTAKQSRLGLFQDSDFAGDFEDSKSTSGGTLCILGSHTFVPISLMCKKQNAVSHCSTESEIISLDAGLRLDGLPALELWDLIVSVLGNVSRVSDRSGQPDNDVHKHHKSQMKINVMENIDSVPSNVQSSRQEALLYVFEDNEAVIKMIIKGRSPTMRHVSRTHRVALDWLFDRSIWIPKSKSNTSTPKTNSRTF